MPDTLAPAPEARCSCGTEIAAGILACPGCHRLVHADLLRQHQADAEAAAAAGDLSAELAAWREAITLVPPQSRQYTILSDRVARLAERNLAAPAADSEAAGRKWLGGLGAAALLGWKFKAVLLAVASKGKLLVLGLGKSSTLFSMLLSLGVYWTAWGLWFALGIVVAIYIHEMGHVAALRRFGIASTAPMFVPGLGAFIRMRGVHLSPPEDARIGLAGPLWGLGAAGAALAVGAAGGGPLWLAVGRSAAWLNAFNLLPVWQLDGSRGLTVLSRSGRWLLVAVLLGSWALAGDGLFVLLALVTAGRAFVEAAPETSDRRVLLLFVFLVVALALMVRVPVDVTAAATS